MSSPDEVPFDPDRLTGTPCSSFDLLEEDSEKGHCVYRGQHTVHASGDGVIWASNPEGGMTRWPSVDSYHDSIAPPDPGLLGDLTEIITRWAGEPGWVNVPGGDGSWQDAALIEMVECLRSAGVKMPRVGNIGTPTHRRLVDGQRVYFEPSEKPGTWDAYDITKTYKGSVAEIEGFYEPLEEDPHADHT